jgi:probable HAF family extracellular repeat protein
MKMRFALRIATIGLVLCSFGLVAQAAPFTYHVIDLGTLGGSSSFVRGINAAGEVVGYSSTGTENHAYVYSGGVMHDLGTLGGHNSVAEGINDLGQVVGQADLTQANVSHAFLYSNGSMNDLGTLGGTTSHAYGIDAAGNVSGQAANGSSINRAFLYKSGVMTDLGTLNPNNVGESISLASSANGYAAGQASAPGVPVAVIFANGDKINLGSLGGGSAAHDVNDLGQAVGISTVGNSLRAFLYSNGAISDLGGFGGNSFGEGINNLGDIVGGSFMAGNTNERAFLVQNGTMYDLNNYLDIQSGGYTLQSAEDINDSGWIAAHAVSPSGQLHGVLLVPVPESASGLLFVTGAAAIFSAWSRRKTQR